MKNIINKAFYGTALVLVAFLSFGTTASAIGVGVKTNVEVETSVSKNSASATGTVKMEDGVNNKDNEDNDVDDDSATSSDRGGDKSQGDEHKSEVAIVVKSLLSIANRDGGIGEDVRLVAQEQSSTSARVKKDMDEVNGESKIKVFFFGTSYKNTGDLRSTIVTTQNHIDRLKKAQDKTASASIKADLEVQIKALEEVSVSTQTFVDAHEGKFSLLGWLIRPFSK